ncbi:pyocin knob domain-containing protein [Xenorhabdus bovienii]|uniref:pyocin knob domain-containing protein n=1 Tax=Xenorhabdus bovienii TaxID=40576 RepID=UPI0023B2EE87|nr:pyocin knob domain-containing protein [Xenorhabdus bovienii]MDE9429653.1 pyocin knob domain-containing protein [Xenorhabdus bovienii]
MIYSDGTTNLVSGSAIVRGTGTQWKSNINGIAAGQIISIQSGNTVIQNVIRSVNSDTELVLAFAPSVSLDNAKYVISTTVPDTVSDGVRHICAINAYIILFLQNMDRWMSENGKVEVEMPNGQKVTLDSIRALQAAMEGKLVKEQNGADIPNKPEFVNNIGLGNALKVGDYGVGSINGRGIPGNDYNNAIVSGIYAGSGGSAQNGIYSTPYGPCLVLSRNSAHVYQQAHYKEQFYYRYMESGVWSNWWGVWSTGNADFDGNGFLKKTSPIIQIHPDGTFTTNDESEGATVTKLGLGHYKLSGILGYNADGAWGVHGGISVPRDVNGNELVYVDDKVLSDGAIEIRVTHRQNAHMPARLQNRRMKSVDEQAYYTDDEPCDLPAGTRLDVRVQMPENSIWNQKQHKSADTAPDVKWPEQPK